MSTFKETIYSNINEVNYLSAFSNSYSEIHGWVSVIISSFAIPLNIINSITLYKIKTSTFKTNLILILIALCDSIIMLVYIPFCIHFYIRNKNSYSSQPNPERDNLFWAKYSIFNSNLSVTFHFISVWLTVYLAFYRYLTLEKSIVSIKKKKFKKNLKLKYKIFIYLLSKSKITMILIVFFSVLICIPVYLFPVVRCDIYENITSSNETILNQTFVYYMDQSDLNIELNGLIFKLSFYLQAILGKMVPCCLLAMFIYLIIKNLNFIKKYREKFSSNKKVK